MNCAIGFGFLRIGEVLNIAAAGTGGASRESSTSPPGDLATLGNWGKQCQRT
jgi:hypothetical protein